MTTPTPAPHFFCGQCFTTPALGRVRVLSVDFDTVRVRRVDAHGAALPGDSATHRLPKAGLR